MAPPTLIERGSPTVVPASTSAPPLRQGSKLPPRVRLLILFVLNLGLHSALLTVTNNFLGNELGQIAKKPDRKGDEPLDLFYLLAPRLGYKLAVVWLGWWLNYDFFDISSLTALANVPYVYLLTTFYDVTPITATALFVNEIIAIALPTYLLRPRSALNNNKIPLRNRYLLKSHQVTYSSTLLAVGVYVVVIYSAITTGQLTSFLIAHSEITTFVPAYDETPPGMALKLLLAGYATKNFLLNPAIGATAASDAATPAEPFNAATANLPQTFKHNFWNFSRRTRTLIKQTVVASIFILGNTTVRAYSLEGTDAVGAAGYSGVWILATIICGGWYVWVGDAES
ncbi:hypothetical protein P280DRAFT_472462 [Massarina eburnea CBS 473.64]|uniref:Uncharacterized protein n=1 Tax=Massarina eburnea CBS 473.64 TaxID=1395130 RepID=A0A6A6RQ06_9PLEO|nr:hypothetical protein P280DRAFT_472462 [Massarina eburnea CBS 473.64]